MGRNQRLENEHFKKEMDHFISPNSLFTSMDRHRIMERIEGAKRRKGWWGKPRLVLSIVILFLVAGSMLGVFLTSNNNEQFTAEQVMAKLYIGMSEQEVWEVLGEDYVEVEPSMDSEENLEKPRPHRYDFPAEKGYVYEEPMDFADTRGVVDGKMGLQVFVYYEDDKLEKYTLIHKEANGKTVIRQVWEDRVEVIPVD